MTMKRSDKFILGSFILALVVIFASYLILYGQYKQGHIKTLKDKDAEQMIVYRPPSFRFISLSGTVWVNIIPSDSQFVELPPGENRGNTPTLRLSGDTLFITGSNPIPLHRAYADWYYRHSFLPINIHVHQPREISITNGQLMLTGAKDSSILNSAVLKATNSTVWIGEYNEPSHREQPKEFFDSLNIQLDNTILLLNRPAVINHLHVRLDNNSELNDRSAIIGYPDISSSRESHVSLTGDNLKKTTINVH